MDLRTWLDVISDIPDSSAEAASRAIRLWAVEQLTRIDASVSVFDLVIGSDEPADGFVSGHVAMLLDEADFVVYEHAGEEAEYNPNALRDLRLDADDMLVDLDRFRASLLQHAANLLQALIDFWAAHDVDEEKIVLVVKSLATDRLTKRAAAITPDEGNVARLRDRFEEFWDSAIG